MTKVKRILVPNEGPVLENIPKGFAVALKVCEEVSSQEIMLLVPHKGNFPTTVVGDFLTEAVANKLARGQSVDLKGKALRCETASTVKEWSGPPVVLAFYLDEKAMRKVDMFKGTKAVVYVPWLAAEGETWQHRWDAEILGTATAKKAPELDPRVTAELSALSHTINLSTGLGHPLDEKRAVQVFSDLKRNRIGFSGVEIERWAVQNGWSAKHAADLREMAERVQSS